jgi:hypothetical protein
MPATQQSEHAGSLDAHLPVDAAQASRSTHLNRCSPCTSAV